MSENGEKRINRVVVDPNVLLDLNLTESERVDIKLDTKNIYAYSSLQIIWA